MKTKKIIVLILILAILTLGCSNKSKNISKSGLNNSTVANVLPKKIMGMQKFVALKGKTALEFVKKSHIGPIKFVKDIALVHYLSNESMMVVWITEYPSEKIAKNQTELMVKGMKKFGSVWRYVNKTELDGINAYYIPGKNHYFFCVGKYMIYLIPINMNKTQVAKFTKELIRAIG